MKEIFTKNKTRIIALLLVLAVAMAGIVMAARYDKVIELPTDTAGTAEDATEPQHNIGFPDTSGEWTTDKGVTAPYGVRIYSITDEGIELYWKKPESVDGYVIFRSYEKDGEYQQIAIVEGQSKFQYFDTDYDYGKDRVYYRVAAYKINGDSVALSELSDVMTAKYITKLKLEDHSIYVFSGTVRTIGAYYGWGNAKEVAWTSSDDSVVAVYDNGTITALSKGKATITCSSEEMNMSASIDVTVDRGDEEMLVDNISHRYALDENGIYVNKKAEQTDDAVIMMVGDLMALSPTLKACYSEENGYNFNACYDYVKDVLAKSDLAVGNLETMIASEFSYSNEEAYINRKPVANAPSTILDAVYLAGFDGLCLSNNHNADCGTKGVISTLDTIDTYGFAHTGMFADADDERFMIFDVNGIKVGYVAYTSEKTGFNGKEADWAQTDIDTMLNYYSAEKASADLKAMKEAGAEYCIAYMHWGTKNYFYPTKSQEETAKEVANLGFDYIAGGHSHTVQAYTEIETNDGRGVPCIYSMGDFNAHINQIPGNRDTVLMRIRLQRNSDGKVVLTENNYIPFYTYTSYKGNPYVTISLDPEFNGGKTTLHNQEKFAARIKAQIGDKIEVYSP
ncbi:MAG: CapA family protein [Clostridia bacterium]|nr:CapA family protein [Clostridia bacterium]